MHFDLVVVRSITVAGTVRVVVSAVGVGARLHKAALVVVGGLDGMTLAVVYRRDDFREFQEDLTFVFADAKALAARHTARTPITGDESANGKFNLSH